MEKILSLQHSNYEKMPESTLIGNGLSVYDTTLKFALLLEIIFLALKEPLKHSYSKSH